MKFTIRDLLWLTTLAAALLAWGQAEYRTTELAAIRKENEDLSRAALVTFDEAARKPWTRQIMKLALLRQMQVETYGGDKSKFGGYGICVQGPNGKIIVEWDDGNQQEISVK